MPQDRWFNPLRWLRRLQTLPLRVRETLAAERLNYGLWFPPALGVGAAIYFGLPWEPNGWVIVLLLAVCGSLGIGLVRRGHGLALPMLLLATVVLGMASASVRTALVAAPVLNESVGPVAVVATVLASDSAGPRVRLLLGDVCLGHDCPTKSERPKETTPERIRLTIPAESIKSLIPGGENGLTIGSIVRLTAHLLPPPAPATPGPFDFQRDAWFQRIGAVGYGYGDIALVTGGIVAESSFKMRLQALRVWVATRLEQGIGGSEGAVAAALATGLRADIPESIISAYRDAGLSHLLAIAGLHLGLAAGVVFFSVRALLALIQWIALRIDTKKAAAIVALLATTAYLLLSGGRIPTERAFMTGGVALLAILLDRSPISLRTLGVAAVVIVLIEPEAVFGPSFQMSFAAVTGLIVTWGSLSGPFGRWRRGSHGAGSAMVRAVVVYFLATLASTTIAGLATAPYTAYHFHRVALYGSVGNVIAIPLASLWIMPWLVVALLLMPFGGDWIAYAPLKLGLHGVEVAARAVSSWPGAALSVPLVPTSVLVVLTLAGLWLAIWRQSWRHWAWPVIFVCVAIPWFLKPPDFIITGDGGVMAGQGQHGLVFSPGTSQAFVREQWQEMWGLDEKAGAALSSAPLTCTSAGCQYRTNSGFLIAVPRSSSARADACQQAAAVVDLSRQMILKADAPPCTAPWTMDATPLKDSGALMLSIDASGHVTAATVSEARGQRPWVTPP